jgi:hypothetical protein
LRPPKKAPGIWDGQVLHFACLAAFLLFWVIVVGFSSSAALAVAAFSHAYIWVHFYATEKPDMDCLYASEEESN